MQAIHIMSETLILLDTGNKEEKYQSLLPQLKALLESESDLIANLANLAAALKASFNFFWVGFYLVKDGTKNEQQLVLGPFQGPLACTRIQFGKGVCGSSWERKESIIVPDVEQFPGHIACSTESKSELVVPVFDKMGKVSMVLDVDSDQLNSFDQIDQLYLEKIVALINV